MARKGRGKRRVSAGASSRKPTHAGRGTRPARPRSISSKAKAHTKAVATIGLEKLKPGPKRIGSTRWLRPSGRGLAVLERELQKMRRQPDDVTFTYRLVVKDMKGRVRGRKGRADTKTTAAGLVLPTKREQQIASGRTRTKRGETIELFRHRIRDQIFANRPSLTKGQYDFYTSLKEASPMQARRYLNDLLKEKGVTFKVQIFREI